VHDIEQILLDLVGVQSDTGTKLECQMAEKIYGMIKSNIYFKDNPELCGTYEGKDILKRPVVWALRKGRNNKTIILMGHYDAVEIESYGVLKPYALNPKLLKKKFKEVEIGNEELKEDLENEDWAFGRGIADMKAGIAINMHTLFTNGNKDINILFIAVPDEENMSSGAIQSIELYKILEDRFNLDYKLCIISEPQFRNVGEDIQLIEGSMGKFLPIIMAKGILTHSAQIFNGLNSGFIISESIRNIELSTEIISEDMGIFTQPPTVQIFKDLKTTYDASVPEYSVACFNVLFLNNRTPLSIIENFKGICKKSLDYVIEKYNEAFDVMKEKGFIEEKARKHFRTEIITLAQLEDRVMQYKRDFNSYKEEMDKMLEDKIRNHEITLQDASIHYMKSLLEVSGIDYPVIVIGIAPPYYPAVNNEAIGEDINYCLQNLSEYMNQKYGIKTKKVPYLSGMTDMSYMSSVNPEEERKFLNNLTLPATIYDVPVEKISELNIPSLMIGPASKDVHQIGERVYMPDVIRRIPDVFNRIIEKL